MTTHTHTWSPLSLPFYSLSHGASTHPTYSPVHFTGSDWSAQEPAPIIRVLAKFRFHHGHLARLPMTSMNVIIPPGNRPPFITVPLVISISDLDQNDGLDGAFRFIRTHSRSDITGNNAAGEGVGPESRWSGHTRARHERATLSPTRSPWRARRPGDALQTATTTCPAKCSYRPSIPSPCSSKVSPNRPPPRGEQFPSGGN